MEQQNQNTTDKIRVRFSTDANCDLLEDNEFLTTLECGNSKEILLERGLYKITARSTEFPDIQQLMTIDINDLSYRYRFDIELTEKVKERRLKLSKIQDNVLKEEGEEKQNKKSKKKNKLPWIITSLMVIIVLILLFVIYNSSSGNIKTKNNNTKEIAAITEEILAKKEAEYKAEQERKKIEEERIAKEKARREAEEKLPPEIYSIEIGNTDKEGNIITDFGNTIYSQNTMYLKPRIRYKSYADRSYTFDVKWIKPDGTISKGSSSPAGYSQSDRYALNYGEGTKKLRGWGGNRTKTWTGKIKGNWKAGNYAIEIWCEGLLLKRQKFTIY